METNETTRASTEVLAGILGAGKGHIGRIFDFIDIAEEELAAAGVPRKRKGALSELFPGPFLYLDEELYRSHAREIAQRMTRNEDLEPGTLAEVMLAMMQASIAAPLTRSGQAVYEYVFSQLMPDESHKIGLVPSPGIHPRQIEEDIAAARRSLAGKRPRC